MEDTEQQRFNEEEELRLIRIEMFKQQILDKLRLPHAPNTSFQSTLQRLPAPMRRDLLRGDIVTHNENTDEAKTTEVAIFATKSKCNAKYNIVRVPITILTPFL